MNTVPYSLRYLPTGSTTGEVLHVLPYAIIPPPHISLPQAIQYGPRAQVFAFFDDMVALKARVENGVATSIDSVEMFYGGNLKTPNEMGIFTRVDGGQLVMRWTRATGVVKVYDPEPPVAAPEVDTSEEPESISIGDDNGIKVNLGSTSMNVTGNESFVVEAPVATKTELPLKRCTQAEYEYDVAQASTVGSYPAYRYEIIDEESPEQELDPESANTVADDEEGRVERDMFITPDTSVKVKVRASKVKKPKSDEVSATN